MARTLLGRALLLLAAVSLASGQGRYGNEFKATLVLEDGTSFRSNPIILPRFAGTCAVVQFFRDGIVTYTTDSRSLDPAPSSASTGGGAGGADDSCAVSIRLTGYRNKDVVLRDGAVVVLSRLGESEGPTVSHTILGAPKKARQDYEDGMVALTKGKWEEARRRFESAVSIYPEYAPAWNELGEVLQAQQKTEEARAAFNHAIDADPKYIKPYVALTKLELAAGRNENALTIAARAIDQKPVEFPSIYFYSALANFNLSHLDRAEKDVREAIAQDPQREIPRAESLLGRILLAKGDRQGAVEHLKLYLQLSPKAPDARDVAYSIAKIEGDHH